MQGEPAVRFWQMLDAGVETIVVVLGAERDKIRPVIGEMTTELIFILKLMAFLGATILAKKIRFLT
ncbi:MAG: hypothetical protein U5L07_09185 [Desulfobacterales bacterium]|nr:hypothetical protein [Desulfobacterales bacterium]